MARRTAVLLLLLVVACGDDAILPGGGPVDVTFRAISERQNAAMCVEGPEFALARSVAEWQTIWDRQNACRAGQSDALPPLLQTEAGVAAWWKVEGCLGYGIKTTRVTASGPEITVTAAASAPPSRFCASAIGGLESFLAVEKSALDGTTRIRFVLDDVEVGSIPLPS